MVVGLVQLSETQRSIFRCSKLQSSIFKGWPNYVKISVKLASLFFGAFGAYLFGVVIMIPQSFWGTINSNTLTSLSGSALFISTITLAFHKLLQPVVISIFYFFHLIYSTKKASRKKNIGSTDPLVLRYQSLTMIKLLSGSICHRTIMITHFGIVAIVGWRMFFASSSINDLTHLIPLLSFLILYSLANFATFSAGDRLPFKYFWLHKNGVGVLVSASLFACFAVGSLYVSDLMNRDPLLLIREKVVCKALPIFPVSTGELLYFPDNFGFAVLRNDGGFMIRGDYLSEGKNSSCLIGKGAE